MLLNLLFFGSFDRVGYLELAVVVPDNRCCHLCCFISHGTSLGQIGFLSGLTVFHTLFRGSINHALLHLLLSRRVQQTLTSTSACALLTMQDDGAIFFRRLLLHQLFYFE